MRDIGYYDSKYIEIYNIILNIDIEWEILDIMILYNIILNIDIEWQILDIESLIPINLFSLSGFPQMSPKLLMEDLSKYLSWCEKQEK